METLSVLIATSMGRQQELHRRTQTVTATQQRHTVISTDKPLGPLQPTLTIMAIQLQLIEISTARQQELPEVILTTTVIPQPPILTLTEETRVLPVAIAIAMGTPLPPIEIAMVKT